MKPSTLGALILPFLALTPGFAADAPFADCAQTTPVFYPGVNAQPLIGVAIKEAYGQKLTRIRFSLKGSNSRVPFGKIRLMSSAKAPYFAPNAKGNLAASEVPAKMTSSGADLTFTLDFPLIDNGWHHLWLAVDVPAKVPQNAILDASCSGVEINGKPVTVNNPAPQGVTRVFPFERRIIPYYRDAHLMKWQPDLLTPAHMKLITDLIFFQLGCDGDGHLTGTENPDVIGGIAKLKALRGNLPVHIVIGLAHSTQGFKETAAKPEARARLASELAGFVSKHGLDGVDFDWEYPDNHQDWLNFAELLSCVKPALYAAGATVSAAFTPSYKMAPPECFDQFDWSNLMSYDRPGEHSTLDHLKQDIRTCLDNGIPAAKIVAGLPFYSNEIDNRNWEEQKGYNYIVEKFPRLAPGENRFTDPKSGKVHYFNGPDLIRAKAREIIRQNIGGAMIWAYDTDVPISHPKSLARALGETLSPKPRK